MGATLTNLTPAEVERRTRAVFEIWNTLDATRITELYTGGHGFGYRTRAARPPHSSKVEYRRGLEMWLATLEYYRIAIEEIHTTAEGNIGVAWGLYREEFQTRGHAPEVMHNRFSEVTKRDETGWHTLFYHRDATPFDGKGIYAPPA